MSTSDPLAGWQATALLLERKLRKGRLEGVERMRLLRRLFEVRGIISALQEFDGKVGA